MKIPGETGEFTLPVEGNTFLWFSAASRCNGSTATFWSVWVPLTRPLRCQTCSFTPTLISKLTLFLLKLPWLVKTQPMLKYIFLWLNLHCLQFFTRSSIFLWKFLAKQGNSPYLWREILFCDFLQLHDYMGVGKNQFELCVCSKPVMWENAPKEGRGYF